MTKYEIKRSSIFKKEYKKIVKQGKNINKLEYVIEIIASGKTLDAKYEDHNLNNSKHFKNCRECHIEPDWLLIYKIIDNELRLYLVETGSHADLFNM